MRISYLRKWKQQFFIMMLAFAMVLGCSMLSVDVQAAEGTKIADPVTSNEWETIFGEDTSESGRIWTDKSVYKDGFDLPLNSEDRSERVTINPSNPQDFLVELSALSATKEIAGQSTIPVDVMLVLDVSPSMGNASEEMIEATNDAIKTLLELNINNRVGVLVYSNVSKSGGNPDSTTVLMELNRYETTTIGNQGENQYLYYDYYYAKPGDSSKTREVGTAEGLKFADGTAAPERVRSNLGSGATYTQRGLQVALDEFAKADGTEVDGVKRMPIMVLMSDGAPTVSHLDYTDAVDPADLAYIKGSSAGRAFLTQLTAAYSRLVMEEQYDRVPLFYTLGFGMEMLEGTEAILAPAVMDPSKNTATLNEYWAEFSKLGVGETMEISIENADDGKQTNLTRIEDKIEDINYVDKYFPAKQASDLNAAFASIVEEIKIQSKYYPTDTEENLLEFSGYLTFEDEIGEYMTVKDVKGLANCTAFFTGENFAEKMTKYYQEHQGDPLDEESDARVFERSLRKRMGINVSQTMELINHAIEQETTYYGGAGDFSNYVAWYSDAQGNYVGPAIEGEENTPAGATTFNRSYYYLGIPHEPTEGKNHTAADVMFVDVRIATDIATEREKMIYSIPASLIPLIEYDITLDDDEITEATTAEVKKISELPIRLVYEVGLQEDINSATVDTLVGKEYQYLEETDEERIYTFYTNAWTDNVTANTQVDFSPSLENEFFFFPKHTPLYKQVGSDYVAVKTKDEITAGETYYWLDYVFSTTETRAIATRYVEITDISIDDVINYNGKCVIKRGTPKRQVGVVADEVIDKTENRTETSKINIYPEILGGFEDVNVLLGNNGLIRLKADPVGDLIVSKTVGGNAGEVDREFNFIVTLDDTTINGIYEENIEFKDGVAKFKLKDGEEQKIIGLPAGVGYTVTEVEQNTDRYTTTVTDNDEGIIIRDDEIEVAFTNEKWNGNLSVKKTVGGNAGEVDREFNFIVTLDDTTINGIYEENIEFKDGVATFKLKDGEEQKILGLPEGVGYTVTEVEQDSDGYTTTVTDNSEGTIIKETEIKVAFTNEKWSGDLTVTKTVGGNAGEVDREFNFIVTLDDTTINGIYEENIEFKDGVAEFKLKDGEEQKILGLPEGVGYTVTEVEQDSDGYTTTVTDNSEGTIIKEKTIEIVFTNEKWSGDLIVTKTVGGNAGDKDREFNFIVTLDDTTINGIYEENIEFKDGVATFKLKDGEEQKILGLPEGVGYTVTEVEQDSDGYTTTVTDNSEGTIIKEETIKVAFTNEKRTGDLEISKKVAGNQGEKDRDFNFIVTLDPALTGTYGDTVFTDGQATFTLKHGETMKITDLPAGVTYTVVEVEANTDGYDTEVTGSDEAAIEEGKTQTVLFTNTKNEPRLGTLYIEKTVLGNGGDKEQYFNFIIDLKDETINETYSGVEFIGGKATIQLKDGESKLIKHLPLGAEYEVIEVESNTDGYDTSAVDAEGIIEGDEKVSFTNEKWVGDLAVSKTVDGNAGEVDRLFTFIVELSDESINGSYDDDVEFINGVAEFQLSHGQEKVIRGLPAGVQYTVTEVEADSDGYTTTTTGESGEIPKDDVVKAQFINEKRTGDLEISKTVAGNQGELDRAFNFTVTVDPALDGTYGGVTFTGGVATFTLTDGETMSITGLPAGTRYTVSELEASEDGYDTVITGADDDYIVEGNTHSVVFTNTKDEFGALVISKTVSGNAGEQDVYFNFIIDLKDETVYESYSGVEFVAGVATVQLKHNEYLTIEGLPAGTNYEVTEVEADLNGYETTVSGENGVIDPDEVATVTFNNARWSGDLLVEKRVEGNAGDVNQDFNFTITLDNMDINGVYGAVEFINGVANFQLKSDEQVEIIGLPAGTRYTIIEAEDSADGYSTTVTNQEGVIEEEGRIEILFINTKRTGDMIVSKQVEGNAGETDRAFNFTVTLDDASINGTYGEVTFENGVATFQLQHDQTKAITGLPEGTRYMVEEAESNTDGYTTVSTGDSGTIIEAGNAEVAFINAKRTGAMTISKMVKGDGAETDRDFKFTVILFDTSINGKYGDAEFVDGVWEFTLKHGESVTITDLPVGVEYEVIEADYSEDDYITVATDEEGQITEDETAVVTYVNIRKITETSPGTKEPEDPKEPKDPKEPEGNGGSDPGTSGNLIKPTTPQSPSTTSKSGTTKATATKGNLVAPKTGDTTALTLWIWLLVSAFAAVGILLAVKRRKTKKNKL